MIRPTPTSPALLGAGLATVYVVWSTTYLGIRLGLEAIPPSFPSPPRTLLAAAPLAGRVSRAPGDEAACRTALLRPVPRVELGLRLRDLASSAIDISDGLAGDLGHVLIASRVGAALELNAVPRSATLDRQFGGPSREVALQCLLAGGDDYELCFTAAPADDARVGALAPELGLALHRVGTIVAEPGLVVRDAGGQQLAELPRAYDHFAA